MQTHNARRLVKQHCHFRTRFCGVGLRAMRLPASLVFAGLVMCLAMFCSQRVAVAQETNRRPPQRGRDAVESSGKRFITPATQKSIDRGLAWLASRQAADGSFGSGLQYRQSVAVTAISGIAFLSAGHVPGRGKYGPHIDRAVDYLLSQSDATGFIHRRGSISHGPMYDHGFATLFLAEVYGMSPKPELREKLKLAVKLIINSQNREGGWRYQPRPFDADLSVTVCQIMALRAARNSGLSVPKSTVDATIKYVRDNQNADGGFRYQKIPNSMSAMPRSAAALVSLFSAGIYEGPEVERGLKYMERWTPRGDQMRSDPFYFYGQYYAVQAMWHAGGAHWNRWFPAIRDELLPQQSADGSWSDPQICSEYGTAMACVILQVPNNYLPIFRR